MSPASNKTLAPGNETAVIEVSMPRRSISPHSEENAKGLCDKGAETRWSRRQPIVAEFVRVANEVDLEGKRISAIHRGP
jgi:hypothetical protein